MEGDGFKAELSAGMAYAEVGAGVTLPVRVAFPGKRDDTGAACAVGMAFGGKEDDAEEEQL
jgi:hypothetical protein